MMDPIIVVEGRQLEELKLALLPDNKEYPIHKLSVHVEGERVKFKINEQMWSAPMGYKREDY